MTTILILKTGEAMPAVRDRLGDFDGWMAAGLSAGGATVAVFDPRVAPTDQAWPQPDAFAGVVVTGSHAMVTDREPWSEQSAKWLRQAMEAGVAVLGVCYGHQLLAHALGGQVGYHPGGAEVGTVPIELAPDAADDALFQGLPARFEAQASHRQSVLRLPDGAVHLARNAFEPNHAFRVGDRAWGVQFHPEFGVEATRAYVDRQAEALAASGDDPAAVRAAVCETPAAASLLPRFATLASALALTRSGTSTRAGTSTGCGTDSGSGAPSIRTEQAA